MRREAGEKKNPAPPSSLPPSFIPPPFSVLVRGLFRQLAPPPLKRGTVAVERSPPFFPRTGALNCLDTVSPFPSPHAAALQPSTCGEGREEQRGGENGICKSFSQDIPPPSLESAKVHVSRPLCPIIAHVCSSRRIASFWCTNYSFRHTKKAD